MKCPRCDTELVEVLTRHGVLVDVCPNAHGVWLDGGEIYFFVRNPRDLDKIMHGGLAQDGVTQKAIRQKCLRCDDRPMDVGRIGEKGPIVDHCPVCNGTWFDRNELAALNTLLGTRHDPFDEIFQDLAKQKKRDAELKPRTAPQPDHKQHPVSEAAALSLKKSPSVRASAAVVAAARGSLQRLPNLAFSSTVVLSSLYLMVFALFVAATTFYGLNLNVALLLSIIIIFIQFLVSPFIMDITLRWFQQLRWVDRTELPAHLYQFIDTTVNKYGMPFPRMGIINDGTPNAFTYGHSPYNARVVITQGLLDILNPDEVEAVVGHELGHAKHWDILIMTVAGMVPVIFYYIYRMTIKGTRRSSSNSGGGKGGGYIMVIGLAAFVLYYISQYIVLYLSRIREYYADRFAGEATGSPDTLATALIKVAYGLAGQEPEKKGNGKKKERNPAMESVSAFGIFDPTAARGLAASSLRGSTLDVGNAEQAMQWDLWNPWALYYEINSTHPLPAKRIQALNDQSLNYKQKPTIRFNLKRPESYWDEFMVDILVLYMPLLLGLAGALLGYVTETVLIPGFAMTGIGAGSLIKVLFSYRSTEFVPMTVAGMLKKIKVSSVRPVPVKIRGRIIGRGVPGLIWSEDIVIRDNTGYIFLDYRQPIRIIEFLFGLFRTERFIGQEVECTGWYRRAPVPYIEIKNVVEKGNTHTCWVYAVKLAVSAIAIIVGVALLLCGAVM